MDISFLGMITRGMDNPLSRLLIVGLISTAAILIFFIDPESYRYPPCFFKIITGLQCPGCGGARASYHLLHGHVLKAIDYNLLFTATLPLVAMEGASRLFFQRESSMQKFRVFRFIKAWQVLVVVMIFWIIRNLPFYPFTLLSSDH